MQLLQGDCLELMKNIPDGSVDMVLCDPPYGIDFQSNRPRDKTKRKPKIKNDKEPFIGFIKLLPALLKDSGGVLCFTRWDVQGIFLDEFTACGLRPKNVIIWDKCVHSMGDLKKAYGNRYESVVFCPCDKFRFQGKRPTDIINYPRIAASTKVHPNQKPVGLLEEFIRQTVPEGGVVLDPFMGSGSTGVACVNTGRDFIGMELDEQYFKIAKERIADAKNTEDR